VERASGSVTTVSRPLKPLPAATKEEFCQAAVASQREFRDQYARAREDFPEYTFEFNQTKSSSGTALVRTSATAVSAQYARGKETPAISAGSPLRTMQYQRDEE
jgi:LAS superfamily LD-carboxypeptidase LdcB